MPLQQTSGNVTADAYGGGVAAVPKYIEDVFSTWLYTGNGGAQTITNNIDLSTYGGLVWIKSRSGTFAHRLTDTARGATKELVSNATTIEATVANGLTAFNSTGFSLGSDIYYNNNTSTYASWTFREQPKFFDIVTYTGNSVSGRAIPHNLGSAPGCVIIKAIGDTQNWAVWHRSGSQNNTDGAYLNTTATYSNKSIELWGPNPGTPNMNATTFSVGGNVITNENGQAYIAYLFAHNSGGFGLTGTDNVISCGSFTADGSGLASLQVLGYEPQWLMFKDVTIGGSWQMIDTMRGWSNTGDCRLTANSAAAEVADSASPNYCIPSATGFSFPTAGLLNASSTYIYIAIRRGPMKVPTVGTSVFSPNLSSAGTGTQITTGFPVDAQISKVTTGGNNQIYDRLRGITSTTTQSAQYLVTNLTAQEFTTTGDVRAWNNTGFQLASGLSGIPVVYWNFGRAPGFFDEVCYTGTGSATTFNHNLGAVPELMIVKTRGASGNWTVYVSSLGNNYRLVLNDTGAAAGPNATFWNNTTPTASVFTVGTSYDVNYPSVTQVAYFFATCPGVSKIGTYTGNGTTQTINCGFTGGARFVLIKATSTTGNWLTFDTARGMTVLTDPVLSLNSTAAETATLGACTTTTGGFTVNEAILAGVNTSGVSFVFLAIA